MTYEVHWIHERGKAIIEVYSTLGNAKTREKELMRAGLKSWIVICNITKGTEKVMADFF